MPSGYDKVPNFETNNHTKVLHIFDTSVYNKNVLHYLGLSTDAELSEYKRCNRAKSLSWQISFSKYIPPRFCTVIENTPIHSCLHWYGIRL